jgi:hypothetical protein
VKSFVAVLGVLGLGTALAGCGGGGHTTVVCNTAPAASADWVIKDQKTGATLSCDDADATTVELGLNGTTFDFPCSAGSGVTTEIPAGDYGADFSLLDSQGHTLSFTPAMSIRVASCGVTNLGTVSFDAQCLNGPAVAAEWSIAQVGTGAARSCPQGATVELKLGSMTFDFDCGAGQGVTTQVQAGSYQASLTLLDGGGNVLSQTQTMTVTVPACGVNDLGNVPFDVN